MQQGVQTCCFLRQDILLGIRVSSVLKEEHVKMRMVQLLPPETGASQRARKRFRSLSQLHSLSQRSQSPPMPASSSFTYDYSADWPSRRCVAGAGAQSLSRTMQEVLLPDTEDWDIRRCMLSIVVQIVDKLVLDVLSADALLSK